MKRITGYFIIGLFSLIALAMYIGYLVFEIDLLMYFVIFIVLGLVFFISYFVFEVLIPSLESEAKVELTKTSDAFLYLYQEFENAKMQKEMGTALRLALQLKHFYNYLPDKDKLKYKSKIDVINSYAE